MLVLDLLVRCLESQFQKKTSPKIVIFYKLVKIRLKKNHKSKFQIQVPSSKLIFQAPPASKTHHLPCAPQPSTGRMRGMPMPRGGSGALTERQKGAPFETLEGLAELWGWDELDDFFLEVDVL